MITNDNQIKLFIHCQLCFAEKPRGTSMKEWSRLEVGWTDAGLQVWCQRHDCNCVNIDFEGQQHAAITTRKV